MICEHPQFGIGVNTYLVKTIIAGKNPEIENM